MPRAARAGHMESFFGVVRKKIMGIRFTAFYRRWRIWHLPLRVLTVTSASSHGRWGKCAPLITASILPPSCPRLPMQSPPWFKELFWLRLHIPREPQSNSTTRCPRPPIHQSKDTSPSMFLADNNAHTSLWTMQRPPRYSCPPIPELFMTVHLGPAGYFYITTVFRMPLLMWRSGINLRLDDHSCDTSCGFGVEPKSLDSKGNTGSHTDHTSEWHEPSTLPHPFLPAILIAPLLSWETAEPPRLSHARGPKMKDAGNPRASQEGY